MKPTTSPTHSPGAEARQRADAFLEHETAFRLGRLPTEQPHPATAGLSETLRGDTVAGLEALLAVDRDLVPRAAEVFTSSAYGELAAAMGETLTAGRRVFFTGCGATGRLSILLESMWRGFWRESGDNDAEAVADRVRSVMAGGDFALIRSVEGFEDFEGFGRHQLREAGVAEGDLVVAVTEGGETTFVIGTAWEALDAGARSFFVFNNPSEVLEQQVERSRRVLQDPRITKLDLATGPMAVAGSTRMQATTIELLVLGTALESALAEVCRDRGRPIGGGSAVAAGEAAAAFGRLRDTLVEPGNLQAMAGLTEREAELYRDGGLVTYFADGYLLDVMTDTTERSPTFSLPPFRPRGDTTSARSWSFVKQPLHGSVAAWQQMLGRPPNGLEWNRETYAGIGAPAAVREAPPDLSRQRVESFMIGNEPDPSRTEGAASLAVTLCVGPEVATHAAADSAFARAVAEHRPGYDDSAVLTIGPEAAAPPDGTTRYRVVVDLPATPLQLWSHLAAKLVLNTVSTASMGLIGRLAGNWMVYVNTSNKKLIDRGVRLIADQTGVDYERACLALFETLSQKRAEDLVGRDAASPVALTIDRLRAESIA